MKHLLRIILAVIAVAILTSGVYALWIYPTPADGTSNGIGLSVLDFGYAPEEVLPGDKEATNLHENHNNLITNIVNHIDYGLNATKKPIVRKLLEDGVPVVYCDQNVSGGNLKHMMLSSSDVEQLMFCVEYSSDTEYIAYTFSGKLVANVNVGKTIEVYKTIIEKGSNGKWVATKSYHGTAVISAVRASSSETLLSIDVSTWK